MVLTCTYLYSSVVRENGTTKFLTKGDNNRVDDRGLYAPGQLWLTPRDVVGRAKGFLPYVGMVTIMMNEYPKLKVTFFLLNFSSSFYSLGLFFTVCCISLSGTLCTNTQRVKNWFNYANSTKTLHTH